MFSQKAGQWGAHILSQRDFGRLPKTEIADPPKRGDQSKTIKEY